jgi:hypothetical protein
MIIPLDDIADRHCRAHKPSICLKPFVVDFYGVGHQQFARVVAGANRASDEFLQRLHRTHVRLFPSEPVEVALPDGRVAHIGGEHLVITFPSNPNN